MKTHTGLVVLLLSGSYTACNRSRTTAPATLIARTFNSGFPLAHDTYNGISTAGDGKIYYVLSSEKADVAAQMYSYDPATDKIRHLGDLTEACGEKGWKAIAQGKSHVRFIESAGKLYFATHIGYHSIIDGMEKPGVPPPGYQPYPGGHFLAYDLASGRFESLARAAAAASVPRISNRAASRSGLGLGGGYSGIESGAIL